MINISRRSITAWKKRMTGLNFTYIEGYSGIRLKISTEECFSKSKWVNLIKFSIKCYTKSIKINRMLVSFWLKF